jgi:predicted lipoprotein with Yx(FWY)xxD motif
MNRTKLLVPLALAGALLAACGSNGSSSTAVPQGRPPGPTSAPTSLAPAAPAPGTSVAVKSASSPLGQILVDPDGRTLYAFTNDTAAKSTCTGTCAEAWPPAVVAPTWTVAPGLDAGVFATITRDDGTLQLTAGKYPLYYFAGDARPGDVNGQGSGDVWFAVDATAQLVRSAATPPATAAPATPAPPASAAIAKAAESPLGTIVVDAGGLTLYAFTNDKEGMSSCDAGCAQAWPPVIVSGDLAVDGLDQSLFSTVDRADGSKQLKMGKWPLYHFAGDAGPGEANGQGSGGSWFVIGTDGKLIK